MVQRHRYESPDELEVVEVVGVDVGGRVDLQGVVVLVGVLKQTIHRIEDLMGHGEEPLPGHAPIIQPLLPSEKEDINNVNIVWSFD